MDIPISSFAKTINFPLCCFIDEFRQWPSNTQLPPLNFLSGDPTIYGQSAFQMPSQGHQLVRESIRQQNHHGYIASNGAMTFRQQVVSMYKTKVPLAPSDVQINHGVNMGLLAILIALTNQGDQVLVPEVGYPFYDNLCPALGRKAVPYKLKKDHNFQIDLEHAASLVTQKTAFMYVVNPANPMGTVFSRKHMEDILAFSDKCEVPLVCDEVYFKMVFPGTEALSFGEVTEDIPVIVLSGVQKGMSVPGWVQSWTVTFDKHKIFAQLKSNLELMATIFLHTNTFVQHSMAALLKEVGSLSGQCMPLAHQNYLKLSQKLSTLRGLKPIAAQGTIYLAVSIDCLQFKDIMTDLDFVRLLKLEQNVNLMPLSIMGKNFSGFRVLTCAGEPLYSQLFERLERFLAHHHN